MSKVVIFEIADIHCDSLKSFKAAFKRIRLSGSRGFGTFRHRLVAHLFEKE